MFSEFFRWLEFRLWSERSILLLVRSAEKQPEESLRKPCPGEFRPVTENNVIDCAAFENANRRVPIYREMLKRGDYGQYGYWNGVCVYREWLQMSGDVTFDGCIAFTLQENECSSQYVFCAPSARNNGFQAASGFHLAELFPQITFYTMVLPEKLNSLRNYWRCAFEIHSRITVKNRFFHRTLTTTPLSRDESRAFWP